MAAEDIKVNVASWGAGNFVHMTYTSPTSPTRTGLNFICGQDYVFHCNPRYDQQVLVLNTKTNGQWQGEERPSNFPLTKGQPTQITAAVTDRTIDVYGNRKQFSYSYNHRYDVNRVNQVHCYGKGVPCKVWVGKALPDFEVGRVVYIKGTAPTETGFNMDLVGALPHNYKTDDFAFHMGVRYRENVVVRNHKHDEKWGQEERGGGMPFTPGQPFTMTVVAQKHGFEVGVNGSHFCSFNYRMSLDRDMSVEFIRLPHIEKIEYY